MQKIQKIDKNITEDFSLKALAKTLIFQANLGDREKSRVGTKVTEMTEDSIPNMKKLLKLESTHTTSA